MKIFITGIAGFIGSTLAVDLIREGHEVYGIDNLFSGFESNLPSDVKWLKADIADKNSYEKIDAKYDAVVHLAAQTSGEKSFAMTEYDLYTNIAGSYNTYKFAEKCGSRLMINFSSMSAYGNVSGKQIVDENYVSTPVSPYGNSKLSAETLLGILSGNGGIPVVSFRLFNAYGPKQDLEELRQGMVSIYLAQFLKHDKVIVKGSFERVRDFVYVDDIVNAIKSALFAKKPEPGVYNLSSGKVTSVGELIEHIREISGIEKEVVSQGNTPGDVMGFGGNNTKLREKYGWAPKFGIREGLKNMISYYMEK